MSFHYRTIRPSRGLCDSTAVIYLGFASSFVYSARILEEFHLIHLDLSPTTDPYSSSPFRQRTIFRWTNYSFPLPLRDREVTTNFTIAALHHQCIWLHSSDAPSRLAGLDFWPTILSICFSGTVGTRTSRLQLLPIQRELRSSTPFSIITSIGGHQFLLNMFSSHLSILIFVRSI